MSESPYKILVVEDNPGDVILIEECLRCTGVAFEMTHCDNVSAALKTLSTYEAGEAVPDLVLLDYNLPGGDGRDILRAAVGKPALLRTRFAVISSSLSPRDREDALESGAEQFIYKPSDLDSFFAQVGAAILELLSAARPGNDQAATRVGSC